MMEAYVQYIKHVPMSYNDEVLTSYWPLVHFEAHCVTNLQTFS